jgi:hypothetical protein
MFENFNKLFSLPLFLISLSVGLLFVYLSEPSPTVIYVYPTPDNINEIEYKDRVGNCYTFNTNEVDCPSDTNLINSIPIQT